MLRNCILQAIMEAKINLNKINQKSYSMQRFSSYQEGIMSWSIKQKEAKHEQDEKVKSTGNKASLEKETNSK